MQSVVATVFTPVRHQYDTYNDRIIRSDNRECRDKNSHSYRIYLFNLLRMYKKPSSVVISSTKVGVGCLTPISIYIYIYIYRSYPLIPVPLFPGFSVVTAVITSKKHPLCTEKVYKFIISFPRLRAVGFSFSPYFHFSKRGSERRDDHFEPSSYIHSISRRKKSSKERKMGALFFDSHPLQTSEREREQLFESLFF